MRHLLKGDIHTYFVFLIFLLMPASPGLTQTPLITEVLPSNHTVNMDPDNYAFPDWIELYNPSGTAYDLSYTWLSDNRHDLKKWRFPYHLQMAPGSYLLLWADSLSYNGKAIHLNFKLSREGGGLYLSDYEGNILDSLLWPSLPSDISYGPAPGGEDLRYFPQPTPGSFNSTVALPWLRHSSPPGSSVAGGFYDHPLQVALFSDQREAVIRYTLDGSVPDNSSPVYSGPLTLTTTTVLRATATEPGKLVSKTITRTYFIREKISLPVISLSMDPVYFRDDSIGFYVEGTNGLTGWETGHGPSPKSNFNRDWKRPVHIEFYDEQHHRGFSADGQVKVYGGWTRGAVIKSFAVYPYEPLDYKLFPDRPATRYRSFIIRNGGNEWARTKLRDAVLQSLAINETDEDLQANRPAVLFINGVFWGVMNIREKINADYIRTLHGIDQDSIDYIESYRTVKKGDMEHYRMMMDFLATHDLQEQDNWVRFNNMVDVKECLNYFMTGIYSGHGDWIYNNNNNLRLWRPRNADGRWRWLLYDTDGAFTTVSGRGIANAVEKSEILTAILRNEKGREYFTGTFTALLNSSFAPERALHMIDSLHDLIRYDMPRHIEKWRSTDDAGNPAAWKTPGSGEYIQSEDGYGGPCLTSYEQWDSYFGTMRQVAAARPQALLNELHSYFGLGAPRKISLSVAGSRGGIIEVNGVVHRDYGHPDTWFDGQTLLITALPRYGYRFAGWYKGGIHYDTLLPAASDWHYLDDGSDPGTGWRSPSFDDSSWKKGPGQLGYGDGDESTVVGYGPDASNKYITTYFRTRFTVTNPSGLTRLRLDMMYDDGAIVYLNGTEVVRVNMASGTIDSHTAALTAVAGENEKIFTTFSLPLSLLHDGENVLAVEIHQVSPASSDISFDALLLGGTAEHSDTLFSADASLTHSVRDDLRLVAVFDSTGQKNTLHLNEIMAKNRSYPTSAPDMTGDWIEIINSGDEDIPVNNLYLTDDLSNPGKCMIRELVPGSSLGAHSYAVYWADGTERPSGHHLNFKLDARAGVVALFAGVAGEMILLDSVQYSRQAPDVSLSRIPGATGPWMITDKPTPGTTNRLFFREPVSNIYINEFRTTPDPRANEWIELYNDNDHPVDAGGLFLTTDLDRPLSFRISPNRPWQTIIPAHGYLVISNHDITRWNRLVLPFRLEPEKGEIGLSLLTAEGSEYLDYLRYDEQENTGSTGRSPDGDGTWHHLSVATPGTSNNMTLKSELPPDSNIILYPNPSRGIIHISNRDPGLRGCHVSVRVFTLTGRLVHHSRHEDLRETVLHLHVPQGIYLLEITGDKINWRRKIEIF